MTIPLINLLSTLLNCPKEKVAAKLSDPLVRNAVNNLLEGRTLRTTYRNRQGNCRLFRFGKLTEKSADVLFAYGGYLGKYQKNLFHTGTILINFTGLTVQQHFYARHRIRLQFPELYCVSERTLKGHPRNYPIGMIFGGNFN